MKKVIGAGLVAGAISLVLGMAVSYLFIRIPVVSADYQNTNLIRPWDDPLMLLFFFHPFIQGLILAWVWNKGKVLIEGSLTTRALKFAFVFTLVGVIPGMFITYVSMPIAFWTIISWTVGGFVNGLVAGFVFAKMNP